MPDGAKGDGTTEAARGARKPCGLTRRTRCGTRRTLPAFRSPSEKKLGRVLLVDPDASLRRGWARALLEAHFEVLTAEGAGAARALLPAEADLLLASPEAADELLSDLPDPPPFVAIVARDQPATAEGPLERAFAAVERSERPPLGLALLAASAVGGRSAALPPGAGVEPVPFAATSTLGRAALRKALGVASSRAPLAILGESGTGKRTLARSVHARGSRRGLLEVELEGLEADDLSARLAPANEDTTVILVRVESASAEAQAALREWVERAQARVISTAAPRLREDVARGRFSRELFFRLAAHLVDLPPLSVRPDDTALLAQLFAKGASERFGLAPARFSREAIRAIKSFPFAANAWDLEAAVVRAVTSSSDGVIRPGDLGLPAGGDVGPAPEPLSYASERERVLRAFEKAYVERVLAHAGGNVSQAARVAGMDPANMRRLLRRVRRG